MRLYIFNDEIVNDFGHVIDHRPSQPWKYAGPKDLVHHEIGIGQVADLTMRHILIGRLPHQVAREEQPRADLAFGQPARATRSA